MNGQPRGSAEFPYEAKYITVNGVRMHYVEAGANDPPVLLLHGIPVHAYLWRNVIPHVAPYARTLALDLIGFGKSDKPLNIEYNLPTYASYLAGAIAALNLKNVVLVAMDLGLMVGLHYAMQPEANVKGMVMFEGLLQPVNLAFKNMPVASRLLMRMLRIKQIAERAFVRKGVASIKDMLALGTVRKLTNAEIEAYQAPWRDELVHRKVWLEGIGPYTLQPKSTQPGDLTDLINRYATKLRQSPIPKLLLYAEPGMAVRAQTIKYAQENIAYLEVKYIGPGKHFLPEDQPENIGQAIVAFCRRLDHIKSDEHRI